MANLIRIDNATRGERIVIDTGRIRGVECGDEPIFWLEYCGVGGAMIVWSGSTYRAALAAAREWARHGASIVDKVGGAE